LITRLRSEGSKRRGACLVLKTKKVEHEKKKFADDSLLPNYCAYSGLLLNGTGTGLLSLAYI
jgi:hypothetical protein